MFSHRLMTKYTRMCRYHMNHTFLVRQIVSTSHACIYIENYWYLYLHVISTSMLRRNQLQWPIVFNNIAISTRIYLYIYIYIMQLYIHQRLQVWREKKTINYDTNRQRRRYMNQTPGNTPFHFTGKSYLYMYIPIWSVCVRDSHRWIFYIFFSLYVARDYSGVRSLRVVTAPMHHND